MKKIIILLSFVCFLFSLQAQVMINSGMKAHYKFDLNYNDSHGNNHLSLHTGGTQYHPIAGIDKSITIAGSIRTSFNISAFNECAISFWFKTGSFGNSLIYETMIQGHNIGISARLRFPDLKLEASFDKSLSTFAVSNVAYTTNVWHHVVLQTNGTTTYLYMNGVLNDSIPEVFFKGVGGPNEFLYLGDTHAGGLYYNGDLNELRIYERTLNQAEITLLSQQHVVTSLNKFDQKSKIDVYPNPTKELINIEVSDDFLNSSVSIRNIMGQEVYSSQINKTKYFSINLKGNSGLYFMELVKPDGGIKTLKLIKE